MNTIPGRRIIMVVFLFFLLLPIYWLVNMSFKTNNEIVTTMHLWPYQPTLENYRIIFTDESNGLSEVNNSDSAGDHAGAALDTVVTQETGLNAYTGKPLKARESRAPQASIVDPTGDALFKPLGGTNVPAADLRTVKLKRTASGLVITATTKSGSIGDAALAARTGFAELVFRWQMGNTLYHAGVWQAAAGGPLSAYAGKTSSVDTAPCVRSRSSLAPG